MVWDKTDLRFFRFDMSAGTQWVASEAITVPFTESQCREAEIKLRLIEDFSKPFSLLEQSPIRISLIQTKPDKFILGIVAHHLAIDGWAISRLLETTCDIYNALATEQELPQIPWESYQSYLAEYQRQQAHPATQKSIEFWRERQFTALPLIEKLGPATEGHRVIYILNKKYYLLTKALAKQYKCTPFLLLLTCFMRSLSRVLKRNDFLVAVPIASRDWDKAEFVIGNCVNLMPLEIRLSNPEDLPADIAHVREQYIQSISHSLVPIQSIQDFQPLDLTQLHFNFEPSLKEQKLHEVEIDFYPFPVNQVEKPVIINVNDTKKSYYIEIDYQFQYLDLIKSLTLFTETERILRKLEAANTPKV